MKLPRSALAVLAVLFAAAAPAETWRFALIGDTPYSRYERRELPLLLDAAAEENIAFVVHAGDFKSGSSACIDGMFADRLALFNASPAPFFYVPGDNEWTDCERVSAGHYDPLERLQKLREMFFSGSESLGQRRLKLVRQPGSYREHQQWRLGPVLFATLNVPGGNNYRHNEPGPEAEARMPVVLDWLRESFALARREGLAGIVIVMQANPGFRTHTPGGWPANFKALLDTLSEETLAFKGEVVLVHGDTHWHRIDMPLRHPKTGTMIANFTRVETYGYPMLGWVLGVIDTDSPRLFRFEGRRWPPERPVHGP